jgi:hypothetical protein
MKIMASSGKKVHGIFRAFSAKGLYSPRKFDILFGR